jgi:regulator-associated protein of mTOR
MQPTTGAAGVREGDKILIPEESSFVLAACRKDDILPFNPQYPADIFTSCLTTPILIAVRYCTL